MGPFVCPRCGTLVDQVPAICRVCGTKLTPPAPPKDAQTPSPATPGGADSGMPWSSVRLLACVIGAFVATPALAFIALSVLNLRIGGNNAGGLGFPVIAVAAFAAAVALIVAIDRRASHRGNKPLDAGCLLILIGVAIVSGLIIALSFCRF